MKALGHRTLLTLLLCGLLLPVVMGYCRVERIRATYDRAHKPAQGTQKPGWQEAAGTMSNHVNTFRNWAVGLLAAIAGMGWYTNLRKLGRRQLILLLLPPAAGMLLVSVWAGVIFERRLAYLKLKEAVGYDNSLNALLGAQTDLFFWSLVPIVVVTVVFFWSLLRPASDAKAQNREAKK